MKHTKAYPSTDGREDAGIALFGIASSCWSCRGCSRKIAAQVERALSQAELPAVHRLEAPH